MNNKKHVLFSAFRNVVPSHFENWMEQQAAEGWHIDKIGQWSSLWMTFIRGEPKKYRFVYDMQAFPGKDYIPTYEQFGWEHLGCMASAHIWRMEYSDKRPEAFSDSASRIDRDRRTIAAVSVSFSLFLLMTIIFTVLLISFPDVVPQEERIQLLFFTLLLCIMALLLGMVMLQIRKHQGR